MCGCRNHYPSPDAHRSQCECPCHAGIEDRAVRCNDRGPRVGEDVSYCRRRSGHEGQHNDRQGVVWAQDPAKADAALIKRGQDKIEQASATSGLSEALAEAAAASSNLAAAWERFWAAVRAIEDQNSEAK